jgi:hypothetical protein
MEVDYLLAMANQMSLGNSGNSDDYLKEIVHES